MEEPTAPDVSNIDRDLRESRLRSLLKAISYRIIGTLITATLTWIITRDLRAALAMGVIEPITKIAVYYLHERAWQLLPRGSIRRIRHTGWKIKT